MPLEIPYVAELADKMARKFEEKIQAFPALAGLLFICVEAVPAPKGQVVFYDFYLGIDRRFPKETGEALIKKAMEADIQAGVNIRIKVFRGVPAKANTT